MKKINIGFFGTRGLANYGGFETIAQKLHQYLDEDKFNLFISKEVDEQLEKYSLEKIDTKTTIIKQKKTWVKRFSKELDNILNESKIINDCIRKNPWDLDIILQCGSTPGIFIKKSKGNPIIVWNPDGIEWKRNKFSWFAKKILYYSTILGIKKSDIVSVDSKNIGYTLKEIIKDKPSYYLPSGTDIVNKEDTDENILNKYNLIQNQYYIMVGRAVPENHILEILEYFSNIITNKKLLIITNFEKNQYSQDCLRIINKNKDKFVYKGVIYNEIILKSLRFYSYAYIHGHSVGGTNPSLLEALGAGNPCICYKVSYNKEVAEDAAEYFDDFNSFKNAIDIFEKNKNKYLYSKNKSQEIINKRFTWKYITKLHENMILDVLKCEEK